MKKVLFFLCIPLLAIGVVYASVGIQDSGTQKSQATDINFGDGHTVTQAGGITTVTVTGASATPTITGGTINDAIIGGSTPAAITGTAITGTSFVSSAGSITLSNSGNSITLLGQVLTVSGTDLYWAGKKLSN